MDKDKLLEALNKSIAREMQVSIQYMWQHVMAVGIGSAAVADIFKKIAVDEMKHAEKFAERINYLGGVPTTKPDPINVGGDLTKMLADVLKAEEEAIALYKAYIKLSTELNDPHLFSIFYWFYRDDKLVEPSFHRQTDYCLNHLPGFFE